MNNTTNKEQTDDLPFTESVEVKSIPQNEIMTIEKNYAELFFGNVKDHLKAIRKKNKKLLATPLEDYGALKEIRSARMELVKLRTGSVAKTKELTEGYKIEMKKITDVGKNIVSMVEGEEKAYDKRIEDAEALKTKEEERIELEAQVRFEIRVKEITDNGIAFDGAWYSINDIQVGVQTIKDLPDEEYVKFLDKVKVQNAINIEKKAKEDEEAANEKAKQDAITLQNQKDAQELKEQRIELRSSQLEVLGVELEKYNTQVGTQSNDEWKFTLEKIKQDQQTKKEEIEIIRRRQIVSKLGYITSSLTTDDYAKMFSCSGQEFEIIIAQLNEKKINQEKEKVDKDALVLSRQTELIALGMKYDMKSDKYSFLLKVGEDEVGISILKSHIEESSIEDWDDVVRNTKAVIVGTKDSYDEYQKEQSEKAEAQRLSSLNDKAKIEEFIDHMNKYLITLSTEDKQLTFEGLKEAFTKQIKAI